MLSVNFKRFIFYLSSNRFSIIFKHFENKQKKNGFGIVSEMLILNEKINTIFQLPLIQLKMFFFDSERTRQNKCKRKHK